jgi:hypothetical protein
MLTCLVQVTGPKPVETIKLVSVYTQSFWVTIINFHGILHSTLNFSELIFTFLLDNIICKTDNCSS